MASSKAKMSKRSEKAEELKKFKELEQPKKVEMKEVEVAGGRFRLNNQRLFLTYKTHVNKNNIKEFFKKKNAIEIEIAHESADKLHPYKHTHVFVDFNRRFQSTSARVFDIESIHPHIKKVVSKKHVENIYRYLCKEDESNIHLMAKISLDTECLADTVWACENKIDALRKCVQRPSDVFGISVLHDLKPKQPEEYDIVFLEWQKYLEDELDIPPDDRRIIWYVDTIGHTGKSYYCRYRALARGDVVLTSFESRDVATLLKNALSDGSWSRNVVIGDIPRSGYGCNKREFYHTIEKIKDGFITASKYQSSTVTFKSPHVVIFSNSLPDIGMMSRDRWDVRDITNIKDRIKPTRLPPIPTTKIPHVSIDIDSMELCSLPDIGSTPPSQSIRKCQMTT